MKNKNGFSIIETLITTVVLTTALISLYVLYNNMMVKEKRRVYYDDPMYIVRTNYLFNIFFTQIRDHSTTQEYPNNTVDLGDLLIKGSEHMKTRERQHIISFSCDNEIFANDPAACKNLFFKFQLYRIYISEYDMSYIHECKNSTTGKCMTYSLLSAQTKQYLKTLPYVPGAHGYYVIFEYYEDGDGNVCGNDNCMRQYASVKYGGENIVVHLK